MKTMLSFILILALGVNAKAQYLRVVTNTDKLTNLVSTVIFNTGTQTKSTGSSVINGLAGSGGVGSTNTLLSLVNTYVNTNVASRAITNLTSDTSAFGYFSNINNNVHDRRLIWNPDILTNNTVITRLRAYNQGFIVNEGNGTGNVIATTTINFPVEFKYPVEFDKVTYNLVGQTVVYATNVVNDYLYTQGQLLYETTISTQIYVNAYATNAYFTGGAVVARDGILTSQLYPPGTFNTDVYFPHFDDIHNGNLIATGTWDFTHATLLGVNTETNALSANGGTINGNLTVVGNLVVTGNFTYVTNILTTVYSGTNTITTNYFEQIYSTNWTYTFQTNTTTIATVTNTFQTNNLTLLVDTNRVVKNLTTTHFTDYYTNSLIATGTWDFTGATMLGVAKPDIFAGYGTSGLVTSTVSDAGRFLSSDGTWKVAAATNFYRGLNTTGLVTSVSTDTNKYLNSDGTWQTVDITPNTDILKSNGNWYVVGLYGKDLGGGSFVSPTVDAIPIFNGSEWVTITKASVIAAAQSVTNFSRVYLATAGSPRTNSTAALVGDGFEGVSLVDTNSYLEWDDWLPQNAKPSGKWQIEAMMRFPTATTNQLTLKVSAVTFSSGTATEPDWSSPTATASLVFNPGNVASNRVVVLYTTFQGLTNSVASDEIRLRAELQSGLTNAWLKAIRLRGDIQ